MLQCFFVVYVLKNLILIAMISVFSYQIGLVHIFLHTSSYEFMLPFMPIHLYIYITENTAFL